MVSRARIGVGLACAAAMGCSPDNLGASDAMGANDGPSDAATDAVPSSCGSFDATTVFCDDFDDSDGSTFTHWSSTFTTNKATVSRIDSDASSPFAVRFETTPTLDGGSPQSELQRAFLTPVTSRLTYAFSIRVAQSANGIHVAPVTLDNGNAHSAIDYLSITSGGTSFIEQVYNDAGSAVYVTHALTDTLATGKWVRVKIEWTLGDAGNTVLVYYDGLLVASTIAIDPRTVISAVQVAAGLSSVTGYLDGGAQLDVDDVLVTVD